MKLMSKQHFRRFFGVDDQDDDDDELRTAKSSTHFTEYSLTSSNLPRNDQLKLLDEKFEQLYLREYADDAEIGAGLDDDDGQTEGAIDPNNSELMAAMVQEYEDAKSGRAFQYERNQQSVDYVRRHYLRKEGDSSTVSSSDTEEEVVEIVDTGRKGDRDRFDCESILSACSESQYRPKLLHDTDRYGNATGRRRTNDRHIRIDPRTGMPILSVDTGRLTARRLTALDESKSTRSNISRLSELSHRPKFETPDERRARKKELKEFRAQRRLEKKANRLAFQEERIRQHKSEMNNVVQKKVAVS